MSRVRALGARTETRDGGQGRLRHTQSALEGRGGWPGSRVGGGFEAGSRVGGGFEAGHRYLGGGTACVCLPQGTARSVCLSSKGRGRCDGRVPSPASVGPGWAAGEGAPVLQDTSPHHTAGVQTRPPGNGGQPHTVRVPTRPVHWAARCAENNESRETRAASALAAPHRRHTRKPKVPYFC